MSIVPDTGGEHQQPMKKVLIVANLAGAYARVSPRFLQMTKLVGIPYRGDAFWRWRKLLHSSGFQSDESLTEQIRDRMGTGGMALIFNFCCVGHARSLPFPMAKSR